MRFIALSVILILMGCRQASYPRDAMFGPKSMNIHPIFTQIKDWTGDGDPDGIEALVELQDQFGDTTKSSGKIIIELFEYRPGWPDTRGNRVIDPWIGSVMTPDAQRQYWSRTSRAYLFQLAYDAIQEDRSYVLEATWELNSGRRLPPDRIILGARPREPEIAVPINGPASQPGSRTPEP